MKKSDVETSPEATIARKLLAEAPRRYANTKKDPLNISSVFFEESEIELLAYLIEMVAYVRSRSRVYPKRYEALASAPAPVALVQKKKKIQKRQRFELCERCDDRHNNRAIAQAQREGRAPSQTEWAAWRMDNPHHFSEKGENPVDSLEEDVAYDPELGTACDPNE